RARPGGQGTNGGPLRARGDLGVHLRGRMYQGVSEERRPRRRHPALQAERRAGLAPRLLDAVEGVMSKNPLYTEYHPRWFRARMSTYWWLKRWSYFSFILRELSSIFIAWFVVYLLLLVRAVIQGDARYQQFLRFSGSPVVVLLNVVSLGFVVFHTVTWF